MYTCVHTHNYANMEKRESEYNMIDWWKKVVFKNYANFTGRARRAEYWWFVLFHIILVFSVYAFVIIANVNENIFLGSISAVLVFIVFLGTLIPNLAVVVRRLHDLNKSGWNFLLYFIPLVGPILMLVWLCTEGDRFANRYGDDPKNEGVLQFDFDKPQDMV